MAIANIEEYLKLVPVGCIGKGQRAARNCVLRISNCGIRTSPQRTQRARGDPCKKHYWTVLLTSSLPLISIWF